MLLLLMLIGFNLLSVDSLAFLQWNVKKLCFEYDTDPYYQALDIRVQVSLFFFF